MKLAPDTGGMNVRIALAKMLRLVEDGVLVRNTKDDADMTKYIRQSRELVTTLKEAQDAIAESGKEQGMRSLGWKAESMPIVFWSLPVDEWTGDPHAAEAMRAEVSLPNGQAVLVDEVRYRGINGGKHGWQGRLMGQRIGGDGPRTAARRIDAAEHMDWGQVIANGGPPCFHLEEGNRFCGRAMRWPGHGSHHDYVSLASLICSVANAQPAPASESRP